MVFGNKVQPIITLEENIDLIDVELKMNIRPQEFKKKLLKYFIKMMKKYIRIAEENF